MLAIPFVSMRRVRWVLGLVCLLAIVTQVVGCNRSQDAPAAAVLTVDNVLQRMTEAYRHATSYQDNAVVRLTYRRDGQAFEDEAPISVCWQAPNQIRVRAYQVEAACDGKQLFARIKDEATRDFDGQVVLRPAPSQLSLRELWEADEILSLAFRQGLAGYPLQLDLLLSTAPLAALMEQGVPRALLEPAQLDGFTCYRVQADTSDGIFVLWVDQQAFTLRKVEYPATTFAPEIAEDRLVEDLQLTVEFRAAELDVSPAPRTFALEVPAEAKQVKRFIPPPRELPSDLFGKTTTPYAFTSLSGTAVSSQSLPDRIKVFVWFNDHPACRSTVQQLNRVYQQYQAQDRIAIYAVCVEPSSITDEQVQALCQAWQVEVPILRDLQALGRDLFGVPWAPTLVVLDGKDTVQIYEVGANPNLVAELPQVLEQLLSGEDVAGEILDQFRQEQATYEKALERGEPDVPATLTNNAAAGASSLPKLLQLRPLWNNNGLKATGNILAVEDAQGGTRFLVFEGWRTVTEIGAQGNLIARHALDLPPMAAASQLQSALDAGGQRYYVAWSMRSPQAHVFDGQWRRVLSYPAEALQHEGVQDALLADLDGDGKLELQVGFWGTEGVHCATLSGRTLWRSNDISHVLSLMAACSVNGQEKLWASSASGVVWRLDHHGRGERMGGNSGQLIHQLFRGTDGPDEVAPYCGIAYGPEGRRLVLGLNKQDESQWRYNLPAGSFSTPIRFVTSAPLLDDQQRHWLIAGTDGSVHIINQDGRFTDFFQTGKMLAGIAGGRYAAAGLLVISCDEGLQALQVSPPATAQK